MTSRFTRFTATVLCLLSIKWIFALQTLYLTGVVLVTLNPSYRPAELEYALRQADVRGLALIDSMKSSDFFYLFGVFFLFL